MGDIDLIGQGNFNNLHVNLKSDNLTVEAKYNRDDDTRAFLNILFHYAQALDGEIPLIVEKHIDNTIKVTSSKSRVTLNNIYNIYIADVKFLVGGNGITDFNCLLSNDFLTI